MGQITKMRLLTKHRNNSLIKMIHVGMALFLTSPCVMAFNSGSTGSDGALNPTADIQVTLPDSGILNYTSVNIPAGVTVTFKRNARNTPVTMLVSGNATIEGTLDVSGGNSTTFGGIGGPGGADGGRGGLKSLNVAGQHGAGPGAGAQGETRVTSTSACAGGGGGYRTIGEMGNANFCPGQSVGGGAYGNAQLIPLLGGSGGGGGAGIRTIAGSGGGGGAGAILVAVSGTLTVNGAVRANGGNSASTGVNPCAGAGGGGSGGGIRIIATTFAGTGTIQALGGAAFKGGVFDSCDGGNGSSGRIRLEAEQMLFAQTTSPTYSFDNPQPVFVANLPAIHIARVAGIDAPLIPTGDKDIVLPDNTPNPVTVEMATSDIPVGTTLTLTATPTLGKQVSVDSSAVAGTQGSGSASASINLPNGPSVLVASTTFTVTASLGKSYSKFAKGEQVEKVKVAYLAGKGSQTTFITVSGKEYTWPSHFVQ